MEAVGVVPEGAQLLASGHSNEVVETILQARAPVTRKLYVSKWKLQDPVHCTVGTVQRSHLSNSL